MTGLVAGVTGFVTLTAIIVYALRRPAHDGDEMTAVAWQEPSPPPDPRRHHPAAQRRRELTADNRRQLRKDIAQFRQEIDEWERSGGNP